MATRQANATRMAPILSILTLNTPTATPTATAAATPSTTATPTPPEPAAGAEREFGGIPFVYVPAGEFLMGSGEDDFAASTTHGRLLENVDPDQAYFTPM